MRERGTCGGWSGRYTHTAEEDQEKPNVKTRKATAAHPSVTISELPSTKDIFSTQCIQWRDATTAPSQGRKQC
ncbi:hypothetical protein Y1Q_0013959 [Alligator mississippiensis]|uniref:Uncharacterized protein n=1 Tax=Alligator mississippiensis TaxID=8496 RepID=A0A151P573_ALLMI|nr:hypothetical protein Y1Q_0013959 [Alligator mississippiensis]